MEKCKCHLLDDLIKRIEQLEKDSHAPVDLRPMVIYEVSRELDNRGYADFYVPDYLINPES